MSMKSRLFASVAAPVLSLPLLIQPVHALPLSGIDLGSAQTAAPGIIRVQEQVAPEGGQEEEIPKRRQQRAEEPEGERPQRRERQADQGEGSERPQRRQQQDAGQAEESPQPRQREQRAEQPEGERPQRRERQADQGEGGERPQRRQQNAEQAPEPAPAPKPDAEQAEQPKPRKERQQQAEQPQAEQPQADQAEGKEAPKPRPQRNADQAPEPAQAPKPDAQQAEQPKPRPERQQQAEQPSAEQPEGRPQQAERPQRPQADQAEGKDAPKPRPQQNADQAPATGQPGQRDSQSRDGQPRDGQQRDGQRPPRQQAQDTDRAPDRSTSGGERNQQRPVQQSAEQPTLPVENGAAVLDSAKEQRPDRARQDGDRPRRDANRPDRQGDQRPRDQQQAQDRPAPPPPRTDADAQANDRVTREDRDRWRNQRREMVEERGERMDRRPEFEQPRGWDILGPIGGALLGQNPDRNRDRDRDRDRGRNWDGDRDDGRVIISIDNQTYVRHNDSRRFYEDGRQPEYERLGDGRYREIVERSDGTRVVTIRNRYGEVVQRSRIVRGGKEYVLYYAPELLEDRQDYTWRDPGDDLPPMRLGVPIDDYIIDTSSEPDRDYYEFLEQPPVERVERPYSLDEVRYSARIRDKVPRIDLDTITFATGSAEIPMNQASSLRKVADAINKVLEKDPSETFLIEGHTDAVGSDDSNLVLSDRRAESVAVVLSDAFSIPPENLTTQGYGERYLKVNTEAANQENRRVTIRRITPLVKPVASNQ